MMNAEQVLKRFEAAKQRKQFWEILYNEAFEYAAPHRQLGITGNVEVKGQRKTNVDRVFDSIAQNALDSFISNIQSSLFPPTKKWIRLKPGTQTPEAEYSDRQSELDLITKTMFEFLKVSNFDTEVSVALGDFCAGVGTLMVNKGTKTNPFDFSATHIAQIYLEEGARGRVDGQHRRSSIAVRNIEKTWPDADIDKELRDKINETPDSEVVVIESLLPQKITDFDPDTKKNIETDGYGYTVVIEAGKKQVFSKEYKSNPWITFRWPPLPGEVYARGPLLKATPDIKTLNLVKMLLLKNGSLQTAGVFTALNDGSVNIDNIVMKPGAIIPVESNGGSMGEALKPLQFGSNISLTQFIFNDLVASINKAMFAEPLGDVDAPVRTATEVAYRQQELARRIGAAFGRLQYELMIPLVNRLLFILEDLGLIDLGNFKVDGALISIEYESPLAQAQDMEEVNNIRLYIETMVGFFGPEVGMSMVKIDEVAKVLAQKLRIESKLIPTDDEIEVLKQAMQERATQASLANAGALPPAPAEAA